MDSLQRNGLVLVLATALISGFSIWLNKFGVAGISPDAFALGKAVLVAAMLAGVIALAAGFDRLRALSRKQVGLLAVVGLVGGSIPFLLFFRGLQLASAAEASFIQKTMFVFVALIAVLVLKQRLDKRVVLFGGLLLVGSALLVGFTGAFSFGYGSLLVLAATVLWAGENVLSKKLLADLPGDVVALGRMGFGALFIAAFMAATGELPAMTTLAVPQWGWIAVTSVVLLAYVVTWYRGLKLVDPVTATAVLLIGSPITTLLNAAGGTPVTLTQAAGGVMLAAGVAGMVWLASRTPTALPSPGQSTSAA